MFLSVKSGLYVPTRPARLVVITGNTPPTKIIKVYITNLPTPCPEARDLVGGTRVWPGLSQPDVGIGA
jgi:hypothetical protein